MGKFGLEITKTVLRFLAFGDVVDEPGEDPRSVDPGFADRKFDRKGVSVAMARRRHAADADDLANASVAIALQIAVVTLPVRGRHEHRDVLADDLLFRIAEQLLGSCAEREDGADFIDDDHRVRHGREDRAQMGFGARAT